MNGATAQLTPPEFDVRPGASLRGGQLFAVMRLNLRIARHTKRLWILALVAMLPVLPPFLSIIVSSLSSGQHTFRTGPLVYFSNSIGRLYLHVVLYVLTLVYGLAVVSDEVEGKTLVHLLLRPIPRWVVIIGKYLAAWIITALLLAVSLLATYTLSWFAQRGADTWKGMFEYENLKTFVTDSAILLFALGAYLALFTCMGSWFRHGERFGVVFCFGWESLITYLPAKLKWMTLKYHVQTLFPHSVTPFKAFTLRGEPLSRPTCIIILCAVIVVFLWLAISNLRHREIR